MRSGWDEDLELLLLTLEMRGEGELLLLLQLEFLRYPYLLPPFLLEGALGLEQLLLLPHGFLHGFGAGQQLFFHSFDLFEELLFL